MKTKEKLKAITTRLLDIKTDDQMLVAFTVLISRDRYHSAIHSGNPIDYLAKDLKRHLRNHGIDSSQLWFVFEESGIKGNLKNPHVHGLIMVASHQREELKKALLQCLGKTSRVLSPFKQRTKRMYSLGWVDYCCKDLEMNAKSIGRSSLYMSQKLRQLISPIFGKTYTSKNLDEASVIKASSGIDKNDCSVSINTPTNPLKTPTISVRTSLSKTGIKSIDDLLKERGCAAPYRRRRK
ncbi:hypothetical protein [Vibrio vulnificus]|uniref:hypothetical protein n=1 Tax=Vibrio vulnificus TaxID=672 RepID=UPI0032429A4C